MSSSHRRRVMVDTDDDDSNDEKEVSKAPRVTPPSVEPSRRRMKVGEVDEDENLVAGLDGAPGNSERVGEGSEEEDEVSRKRKKQLAERWSKLGDDSDHGTSGEEDAKRRPRRELRQMSVFDAWGRRTPSKSASRLLVSDPVSGDDDDQAMDEMEDFIVDDMDEGQDEEDTSRAPPRRGRKPRGKAARDEDESEGEDEDAANCASPSSEPRSQKRSGTGGSACETKTKAKAKAKAKAKGGKTASKKRRAEQLSDEDEVDQNSSENEGGPARRNRGAKRKRKDTAVGMRSKEGAASPVASSSPGGGHGDDNLQRQVEEVGAKTSSSLVVTPPGARGRGRSREVHREVADSSQDEAQAESPAAMTRSKRAAAARKKAPEERDSVGMSSQGVVEISSDTDDEDGSEKEEVEMTPKVASGGRRSLTRSQRRPTKDKSNAKGKGRKPGSNDTQHMVGHVSNTRSARRSSSSGGLRRSSRVNYRAMLMESSSEDEDGPRHDKTTAGEEGEEGEDEVEEEEEGSDEDGDEDYEQDGDHEEEEEEDGVRRSGGRGRRRMRCATDEDADKDDSFARDIGESDDDEDTDEEEFEDGEDGMERPSKRAVKTGRAKNDKTTQHDDDDDDDDDDEGGAANAASGLRRSGRGSSGKAGRYGDLEDEDEGESSEDDGLVDDDDDEDEGDAFFSHAALFQEQEQAQEFGMSSLSLETMTFYEAFLIYVEYLAKAVAPHGAGQAFMKKYVAQPMLPDHARYAKAKDMVEKKVCVTRESLCGTWRQEFRNSIFRFPHYGYQHVDMMVENDPHCHACNRMNKTRAVAFLSGAEYDPVRVWESLRWDRYLPRKWDDPDEMAASKKEVRATHQLGDTCKHKSHLYHSLVHYKLYLVCKIAGKLRSDRSLKPENFRGEGGPNKKKTKRCLHFTENEFESLSGLVNKANDMNGVKWGSRVGVRGGHGKTFLQLGAEASIVNWLSGETQPGEYGTLDMFRVGGGVSGSGANPGSHGGAEDAQSEDEEEEEAEFSVGRGRTWQTVGSTGGRYG